MGRTVFQEAYWICDTALRMSFLCSIRNTCHSNRLFEQEDLSQNAEQRAKFHFHKLLGTLRHPKYVIPENCLDMALNSDAQYTIHWVDFAPLDRLYELQNGEKRFVCVVQHEQNGGDRFRLFIIIYKSKDRQRLESKSSHELDQHVLTRTVCVPAKRTFLKYEKKTLCRWLTTFIVIAQTRSKRAPMKILLLLPFPSWNPHDLHAGYKIVVAYPHHRLPDKSQRIIHVRKVNPIHEFMPRTSGSLRPWKDCD